MSSISLVADESEWLPHRIDEGRRRVQFQKFDRSATEGLGFLADKTGSDQLWLDYEEVLDCEPEQGATAFIFHSGFCRSTLLLHALRRPGRSRVLNEPEILNAIARQDRPDPRLADSLVGLLAKPACKGETVLIKPSNFPNRLMAFLLEAKADAKAIIITNSLHEFLEAVARKGLQGRQWGRQVYHAAARYAGKTQEFDKHIPGMTDLQVAALGWLLMQNWFQSPRLAPYRDRIKIVHSACFNARRRDTIALAAQHLGLGFDAADIDAIMDGPVFQTDAKTGDDFKTKDARDAARYRSSVLTEEIDKVQGWIEDLAVASGIAAPVPQSLF